MYKDTCKEIFRISKKYNKRHFILSASVYVLSQTLSSFITIFLPAMLLYVSIQPRINNILLIILGTILVVFGIIKIIQTYSSKTLFYDLLNLRLSFIQELGVHCMKLPYQYLEDSKVLTLINQSQTSVGSPQLGLQSFIQNSIDILYISVLLLIFSILCLHLHFILFIGVLLLNGLSYLTLSKSQKIEEDKVQQQAVLQYKKKYLYQNVICNHEYAKEIRIFQIQKMLLNQYTNIYSSLIDKEKTALYKNMKWLDIRHLNNFLFQLLTYVILMKLVFNNQLSFVEYTFYISLMSSFFMYMQLFIKKIGLLKRDQGIMSYYFNLMDYDEDNNLLFGIDYEEEFESLEFKNVCFSYGKREILKNISFRIERGKKLALVGINGAGKSTIIKLICRFYQPTHGKILLNGMNIQDIELLKYRKYISIIFQDIHLYPFTLLENVSMELDGDQSKFDKSIHDMGMDILVDSLPYQKHTKIGRNLYKYGVDFSGGQRQKLCLSRAIYKNAPILILDEPTSASDPLSELKFFQHFQNHFYDKACLLISHRLAATRFCDHILLLKDGTIKEKGTFEELMDLKGNYFHLYHMQLSLYSNEEEQYEEDD